MQQKEGGTLNQSQLNFPNLLKVAQTASPNKENF